MMISDSLISYLSGLTVTQGRLSGESLAVFPWQVGSFAARPHRVSRQQRCQSLAVMARRRWSLDSERLRWTGRSLSCVVRQSSLRRHSIKLGLGLTMCSRFYRSG